MGPTFNLIKKKLTKNEKRNDKFIIVEHPTGERF